MRWIFWSYYSVFVHEDFYPHLMMKLLITLYIFTLYPGWRKSVLALYGFFSFLLFFFYFIISAGNRYFIFYTFTLLFLFFLFPTSIFIQIFLFYMYPWFVHPVFSWIVKFETWETWEIHDEKFTIRTSDKCHENNLIFFFSLVRSTFAFYYCFITIFGWSDILQIFPGRPQFQFLAFQHFKDHSSEQRFLCKLLTKCSWWCKKNISCLGRASYVTAWQRETASSTKVGTGNDIRMWRQLSEWPEEESVHRCGEMILVTLWRGVFVNQHCTYIHVLSNSVQNF